MISPTTSITKTEWGFDHTLAVCPSCDWSYLIPAGLTAAQSIYRENSHIATSILDLNFPQINKETPKLSVGGSLFISSGSRPTQYFQPLGRFSLPLFGKTHAFVEWRWYSLGERFYLYEGFRSHQLVAGLRLGI